MKIIRGFEFSRIDTDCEILQKLDNAKISRFTVFEVTHLKIWHLSIKQSLRYNAKSLDHEI